MHVVQVFVSYVVGIPGVAVKNIWSADRQEYDDSAYSAGVLPMEVSDGRGLIIGRSGRSL